MKMTKSVPVIVLLAFLAACSSGSKESTKIEEGENLSKNPLGAFSQLAKAGSDLEKIQKDLENMKPVEALHFNELIKYLPEAPGGWEAEAARGETNQMGEWKLSQASRQYNSGDKSMEVQIQDWAYQYGLYAPFFLSASFSQETTEGYNKGIKVGEDPGREEYQTAQQRGNLSLLIGKRFLVSIKGSTIEAAELRTWLDSINTAGLRGLAQAAQQ